MKTAIVIGGGIAGCSTAYALAKRGTHVTLIERQTALAQGASGNPVAMLYPKFNSGKSILSDVASAGFSYTHSLLKQCSNAQQLYDICGQIQLAFNAREQAKQQASLNNKTAHTAIEWLDAVQLSEKANIPLSMDGLWLPEAGWVKPQQLCAQLTQSDNIHCITNTEAITVQQNVSQWQVTLAKQSLLADIVVICNANDIKQFPQCQHIAITPVRGQVNFFTESALSKTMHTIICTDHYLSPAIDGIHAIGTSYAPNDLNPNLSAEDTQSNLSALNAISTALFNQLDSSSVTGRVAWRSATRDYVPLAGQLIDEQALRKKPPRYNDNPADLPWLTGLYVNAGHGSKGMITAPMCAELIANQINQEPFVITHRLASALNPSRFLLRDIGLKRMTQNLFTF